MTFFLIYLFSVLLLGAFNIGPYSLRVYLTIIMLGYLLMTKKQSNLKRLPKSYIYMLIGYVFFCGFSYYINGIIGKVDFFKDIFAYHLVAITTYFAVDRFVINSKSIKNTINLILIILIVDVVVTILQYYNISLGWSIAKIIAPGGKKTIVENMSYVGELGSSSSVGLFGYGFTNATYIACVGMLIYIWIVRCSKNIMYNLLAIFVVLISLYAVFVLQQRAAFYSMLCANAILWYKILNNMKSRYILILLALVFIVVVVNSLNFDSDNVGRLSNTNLKDDSRFLLWTLAISHIKDNIFWGNPISYTNLTGTASHNYFLNALINSGIFGALFAFFSFLKVLINSYSYAFCNLKKNSSSICIAAGVLIYMICSLFHNASLMTGDTIIYLLLALMLRAREIENSEISLKV